MKADLTQSASEGGRTAYDEVPYPSYPFAQTHPARLATVATLFGMHPAPVDKCRVLELGCASGGNLLPMADLLPDSTFIGIDASQRQISEGLETLAAVGLRNIELRTADILDIEDDLGQFDYIICHGVYSWVPENVQQKILSVCKRNLSPQGVAYVSYNTYPGWNMRRTVRDMMNFHAAKYESPRRRVLQARKFLDFVADSVNSENSPYGAMLKREVDQLRKQDDNYIAHEHLEAVNAPCYFHEFARAAQNQGLQYLGEADIRVMQLKNFGPKIATVLSTLADDQIELEQYMDFIRNRAFRQTLLCHSAHRIDRRPSPKSALSMYTTTSLVQSTNTSELQADFKFEIPNRGTLSVKSPLLAFALRELITAAPARLRIGDLYESAKARCTATSVKSTEQPMDSTAFAAEILSLYTRGICELSVWEFPCSSSIPLRPIAPAVSRFIATQADAVPNRQHELVQLSTIERHLIQLLDGTRDESDVLRSLSMQVTKGTIALDGLRNHKLDETEKIAPILRRLVVESLTRLHRKSLLSSRSLDAF